MQKRLPLMIASFLSSKLGTAYSFIASPARKNGRHRVGLRRRSPSFHSSTACGLNRFLFRMDEVLKEDMDTAIQTITLPKEDYRTVHAAKILGLHSGDTLRAGIVSDQGCDDHDGFQTDTATVDWIPQGNIKKAQPTKNGDPPGALRIYLRDLRPAPASAVPPVSLILALPRPLQLGRMLPMISQMGVDHIVLTEAHKVPKDYFGSHLFRQPHQLTEKVVQGLEQAGDVRMPKITIVRNLSRFLGDDLERYFPVSEYARVIAHPTRPIDPVPAKRMRQCIFPGSRARKIVVAVGPEGGWDDPYELGLFTSRGFEQITMGSRVLRSDCAVVSLLSLAHDVCCSD